MQATWLEKDFAPGSIDELKKRPEFLKALRKRDIEQRLFVGCFAISPGYRRAQRGLAGDAGALA